MKSAQVTPTCNGFGFAPPPWEPGAVFMAS